jgi:hypothetical protein
MKRAGWICAALVAGVGVWAAGSRPASATEPNEDAVVSSTVLGTDLIVESLSVGRHFAKSKSMSELVFERRREDDEVVDEPSGLAWRLGYAFARPSAPVGSTFGLSTHGFLAGLSLRSSPSFAVSAWVRGETTPDLDYQHGLVGVRADFMIPLASSTQESPPAPETQTKNDSSDEESASEYYRKRSKLFNPPKPVAERPEYPRLRAGALLQFEKGLHQGDDTAESSINYYAVGPDLAVDLDPSWTLGASGMFYVYADRVLPFLQRLGLTTGRDYTVYSPAGLVATGPQVLVFPDMVFDQHITYRMPTLVLDLNLNETLYVLGSQSMSFTVTPTVTFQLSQRWLLSAGINLGLGGAETSIQGVANLLFRL